MILHLFIALLGLTAAALMITQGRRRRIWSFLLLGGLGAVVWFFTAHLHHVPTQGFIYQWLPYDIIKADFNISSSLRVQKFLSQMSVLLIGLVYFNTFYKQEKHALHANTLLLLNFCCLILLVSSHDFLQLMFASFMLSLIGFYMLDGSSVKKDFFVFTFLSDMVLFGALAVIYGKTGTISLMQADIAKIETPTLLVAAILLTLSIGSKIGLFLLNGHYFLMKDLALNRLIFVLSLSVPLSGIILASKLSPFLGIEPVASLAKQWGGVSICFAFLTALISKDVQSRLIALSNALCVFGVERVLGASDKLYETIPLLMGQIGLLGILTFIAEIGTSGEKDITKSGGFWRLTKLNFLLTLLGYLALSGLFAAEIFDKTDLIFFIFVLCVSLTSTKQIYFGKTNAEEKVIAFAQNISWTHILPITFLCCWTIERLNSSANQNFIILLGVAGLFLSLIPTNFLRKASFLSLDMGEQLVRLYRGAVLFPLKALGRILWLVFDVIMIERNIVGSVSSAFSLTIKGLQKVQTPSFIPLITSIGLGIGLFALYCWRAGYE